MNQQTVLEYIGQHSSVYFVSANSHVDKYNPAISVYQQTAELPRVGKGRFKPVNKTWRGIADKLATKGLVSYEGSNSFRLTDLGAAKLGISLQANMLSAAISEYARVRTLHAEFRSSWLSWLDYRRYATNKCIVNDAMMNQQSRDFCWIRYEGISRLGYKVSFLSPRTSLDNWQSYEVELQTLERLITCLESGISINRV